MARPDEFKLALFNIGGFLALGAAFLLLGLITPAITPQYQAVCWETAALGFVAAAVTVWRHPVVWFPVVRCWYNRLRRQKARPPAPHH